MTTLFLAVFAAAAAVPAAPSIPTLSTRAVSLFQGKLAPHEGLEVERAVGAGDGQVIRLQQTVHGVPVWRGGAAVRLDAQGRELRRVDARKEVGPFDPKPLVSAREAANLAALESEWVLAPGAAERAKPRLVVVPGAKARLAWEIRLAAVRRSEAPVIMIDARDGSVLASWNHVFHDSEPTPDLAAIFPSAGAAVHNSVGSAVLTNFPTARDENGFLVGERVIVHNCCPNEGCDPSKGPLMETFDAGQQGTYSMALCDERPRATNARPSGNYVYAVPPEPDEHTPVPAPADGDEFAEVNAYYHLNVILDHVAHLDPFLHMRELATPMHMTTNYLEADYNSCTRSGSVTTCNKLARYDNAYFMPGDGSEDYPYDQMVFGQGAIVDYAYDADVIYHEFGHAVVQSVTGDLYGMVLDSWGAWVAPGALNEGLADWLASSKTNDPIIGDYAGQYGGEGAVDEETGEPILSGIRDLTSGAKCPDNLENEVHSDSLPFTNALWELRSGALAGLMLPDDIDRAILDAMKVLPTEASFDITAIIILEEIKDRAPAARQVAEEVFRKYGVLECERAWLLTAGGSIGDVPLASRRSDPRFGGLSAPSPWQIKLIAPEGATEAVFTYRPVTFHGTATLRLAYSVGDPVRLTYSSGTHVEHGTSIVPTSPRISIPLPGVCGERPVYIAVINEGSRGYLTDAKVSYKIDQDKVDACHVPPPVEPPPVVVTPNDNPPAPPAAVETPAKAELESGCGCTSGAPIGAWPALLALLALGRRRRS